MKALGLSGRFFFRGSSTPQSGGLQFLPPAEPSPVPLIEFCRAAVIGTITFNKKACKGPGHEGSTP